MNSVRNVQFMGPATSNMFPFENLHEDGDASLRKMCLALFLRNFNYTFGISIIPLRNIH